MYKVGRNDHCPCASGKKYKHCHGSPQRLQKIGSRMPKALPPTKAQYLQQQRQQGLGKGIVSSEIGGHRFVAVKNRLLHSQKWLTFHEFLVDYIRMAIGPEWCDTELTRPPEKRHPILVWYSLCRSQLQYFKKEPGKVYSMQMTGAMAAYLHLAYNLYTLDHNAELQEKLIARLRNHDNFSGACYEVFVASTLIRAGFEIEFENEDARNTSHCEFTATSRTGNRFSVEAKHRAGHRPRLGRLLNKALAKHANHKRIVFLDINMPDEGNIDRLNPTLTDLRAFEGRIINDKPLPEAYLIITNIPWHHHLETKFFRHSAIADGFQIPDFKADAIFPSLRAQIEARERHIEIHELIQSMHDHTDIPSTFNGEIPEFVFGNGAPRLLIGQRYLVSDDDGTERIGLLKTATVMESEQAAYCILSFVDGKTSLYKFNLSETEMAVWQKYQNTFFGEVVRHTIKSNNPLDQYDCFYNTYRHTSKERLLEFLTKASDINDLRQLDQSTLASIYAERLVCGLIIDDYNSPKPTY
jgi:hypothetical protein